LAAEWSRAQAGAQQRLERFAVIGIVGARIVEIRSLRVALGRRIGHAG
jgi:hypothetical protein